MDELDDDVLNALPEEDEFMRMAEDAFVQSDDWFDASIRPTVEKALAHFSNRHAKGAKYHTDSYKFRAKGFRPKTRATIRRNEAAAAVAFFSTADMVSITAEDTEDKQAQLSAAVLGELVNYRLDDSIPWFVTLVGAYQNSLNLGVTISHQYWDFEEEVREFPVVDAVGGPVYGETGEPESQEVRKIVTDKPRIDLVAIENFRISPAADWADPIGSSPYIIELIPMFIGDIKSKMSGGEWQEYEDGEIAEAVSDQYDSIRQARDGVKRQDSLDVTHATSEFDTVFVHRNIIRKDGEDWLFYSLGTRLRLSEPKKLTEVYRHLRKGERPYVMGRCIIEAHKSYPAGLNELVFGLQEEANDIQNQRRDNVSLILNKRYFARRTANIDYRSLTRNVPGSITLVDDITNDIRWDSPGEVTGSSYQEQDRVSSDYDELAGTFSPGSVQSNRAMNETVGGMNLLQGDANTLTEYQLRVFSETWVEPVLKQLCRMEQAYETDQLVMGICGRRAQAFVKFGVDEVTDAMLQGMVTVRVNAGFGATQPEKRVAKLTMGLQTIGQFMPNMLQSMDPKEVITEIFGALGYKGAERFFPSMSGQENPQLKQMQDQIQQLQQVIQTKQIEQQGKLALEDKRQQGNLQNTQLKGEIDFQMEKLKAALAAIDKRLDKERNQIEIGRLQNERIAVLSQIKSKSMEMGMANQLQQENMGNRRRELDMQDRKNTADINNSMSDTLMNNDYGMIPNKVG
jgi:hypothetical protein